MAVLEIAEVGGRSDALRAGGGSDALHAWEGLRWIQERTLAEIGRALRDETGLSASWYEVLACLAMHSEGRRMADLADQLLMSRGGTTKLISRLEEAGYVDRRTPRDDRRATYAVITPAGREAIASAHAVQAKLIERHFGRFVDRGDLACLGRIVDRFRMCAG